MGDGRAFSPHRAGDCTGQSLGPQEEAGVGPRAAFGRGLTRSGKEVAWISSDSFRHFSLTGYCS
jgi:hypothetical protein